MPSHRPRLMLPTSLLVGVVAIGLGLAATTAQAAITHPFLKAFGPQGSNSQGPLGVFSDLQSIAAEQSSGDVYVYDAGFEEARFTSSTRRANRSTSPRWAPT